MAKIAGLLLVAVSCCQDPAWAAETCASSVFAGAQVLQGRLGRAAADRAITPDTLAEARGDLDRVVAAILGLDPRDHQELLRGFLASLESGTPTVVACDADVRARDTLAYRLASVGYPASAIASIVSGTLSRRQIDTAYASRMAGYLAADSDVFPAPAPSPAPEPSIDDDIVGPPPRLRVSGAEPDVRTRRALAAADVDAHIRRYARAYRVDPRLVYAIIRQESNWYADVVSPKGARGLMQLMPATAAMLSVDPDDPLDNIRGGIVLLADLLQTYGNARDALIAYNAGPKHANQVLRGERTLFGETRRYLEAIGRSYPLN